MTDTITKIRALAEDFADSGRTYEGCDVARALNGFADRCDFLTNPTRSDEELRSAAVDVLRRLAANSDARSDLTKRENDAIIAGRGTEDFADEWLALRDEAKELAQESRDLLSALSQAVEDPPPTATETSEPVSESVDCSRGGDGLCECGGGRFIDRLMAHSDGNVWIRLEGENLAQIESLRGDVVSLEVHRAPLGEGEPWCATNPSPPEEGVRLKGAVYPGDNHSYIKIIRGDGSFDVDKRFDCETVEILVRPLSEGSAGE